MFPSPPYVSSRAELNMITFPSDVGLINLLCNTDILYMVSITQCFINFNDYKKLLVIVLLTTLANSRQTIVIRAIFHRLTM